MSNEVELGSLDELIKAKPKEAPKKEKVSASLSWEGEECRVIQEVCAELSKRTGGKRVTVAKLAKMIFAERLPSLARDLKIKHSLSE